VGIYLRLKRTFQKNVKKRIDRSWNLSTLKKLAPLFKPYRFKLGLATALTLLMSVIGLTNPLLTKVLIDEALLQEDLQLLLILTALMLAATIIWSLINIWRTYLSAEVGNEVMRDMRIELFDHLQRMPIDFFTMNRTGEMQSRLANDVGGVESVLTDTLMGFIRNISSALSVLVAMLILSPLLTLVSVWLIPFVYLLSGRVGNSIRKVRKDRQQALGSLTALMQESLSGSGNLLVKLFLGEPLLKDRFSIGNEEVARLGVKQQFYTNIFSSLSITIFTFAPVFVFLVAGIQLIRDEESTITIGIIVAFVQLQSRLVGFNSPITQLLNLKVQLQGALGLFERIFEYSDLPIEKGSGSKDALLARDSVGGRLEFNHVYFSYSPLQHPLSSYPPNSTVLKDVSFSVDPGQMVALVGPSGAGKSTIASLIPRLYEATGGEITLGGQNILDIPLHSLRSFIGMVTQETFLLHDSIRNNLLFAKPGASEEEMVSAAKAAAIHERIIAFEDGYDEIVGERGDKLSGGEKQRISLARVFLKDPKILILDEATSSLDSASEKLIQKSLERLMKYRTVIVIAHRLSTIQKADQILVLKDGTIVERGKHEALKESGFYAELLKLQRFKA
jgi:ATP-binding cassette subfamily B protein